MCLHAWLCFGYCELPAVDRLPVHAQDRAIRCHVRCHVSKGKAPSPACVVVRDHPNFDHIAMRFKELLESLFGHFVTHVPNVDGTSHLTPHPFLT